MCGPRPVLGRDLNDSVAKTMEASPEIFGGKGAAPATAPGVNPSVAPSISEDAPIGPRRRGAPSATPFRTDLSIPSGGSAAVGNGINIPR
jgi:hypothetical protein